MQLPASFNGLTGANSGQSEEALTRLRTEFSDTQARIYGGDTLGLVLIVGFRPKQAMSPEDQQVARNQLVQELNASNTVAAGKLNLAAKADAGALGGYFGCGEVAPATVCVATDAGSMVAVVLGPGVRDPQGVALRAREASVTRA